MSCCLSPLDFPIPEYPVNALGVYVHVPFCRSKCPYCDFYSVARVPPQGEFPKLIKHELSLVLLPENAHLSTLYFGGGTPSLLPISEIAELVESIHAKLPPVKRIETTVECNPERCSADLFAALRDVGINRVSLGVQSLHAPTLTFLGRRHGVEESLAALEALAEAGFDSYSVDLIFGVPNQRDADLLQTLSQLLTYELPHISAYHLTVEPATSFGLQLSKGAFREVDEDVSERQFRLVHDFLTSEGYVHYEVSNYARPGHIARHNTSYWLGVPYLGLGPSAHSYNGQLRAWNISSYSRYSAALHEGLLPREEERLSEQERYSEWLMTRLRTIWGVSLRECAELFGNEQRNELERSARSRIATGDLQLGKEQLAIPPEKFLLTDAIILDLLP